MPSPTVSVRGIARNVTWHEQRYSGNGSIDIFYLLTFQLEEVDHFGNISKFSAIEFKVENIQNVCTEGDELEVTGIKGSNNIIYAEEIKNTKTSSTLKKQDKNILSVLFGLFIIGFSFCFAGFIFVKAFSEFRRIDQIFRERDQERSEAERLKQEEEKQAIELSQRFCVVKTNHNIVSLHETPNAHSQEIFYIPVGYYIVHEYTLSETGSGNRWLKVEFEGRQGWIQDSAWHIAEKSDLCP